MLDIMDIMDMEVTVIGGITDSGTPTDCNSEKLYNPMKSHHINDYTFCSRTQSTMNISLEAGVFEWRRES